MTFLFNRELSILIDTSKLNIKSSRGEVSPTLKAMFKVERNLSSDPNKGEVVLNNLSDLTRSKLSKLTDDNQLIIEAGYGGIPTFPAAPSTAQIFQGNIDSVTHQKSNVEWVTKIQSADGGRQIRKSRVIKTWRRGTPLKQIILDLAKSTKLNLGNLGKQLNSNLIVNDTTAALRPLDVSQEKINTGVVAAGNAFSEFRKYVKAAGFGVSIQDGQIQLLRDIETVDDLPTNLTFNTGLIGSPELGEKGIVKARSLLQPRLIPGKKLFLQSKEFDGLFKILKVIHSGDTWGSNWFSDIECKAL